MAASIRLSNFDEHGQTFLSVAFCDTLAGFAQKLQQNSPDLRTATSTASIQPIVSYMPRLTKELYVSII